MRAILFGATGMVGQGVLRECLIAPEVESVLSVGRSATGKTHAKLRELLHSDFSNFSSVEKELTGYDACFFCLGISSAGMTEPEYRRVTYGFTLAAGETLARLNPGMVFVYVSGAGTDSTERGRSMWARVKGETENALLRLPLRAYMFRPAYIQPLHGATSRTAWTRAMYSVLGPLYPIWKALFPRHVTTTEEVGRAMIGVAASGSQNKILESEDIRELGRGG
jgi:uncharacterized protein YbjT (DUF2867 family)